MATYRQIVYMVLDEIKALGGDSIFTEDHIIFLANAYRLFLIEQKREKEKQNTMPQSSYQTICVTLEKVPAIADFPCEEGYYLRSVEEIPYMVQDVVPKINTSNQFNTTISYVTKERMKYVGYNKYMQNMTYATLADDRHIYLKSNNPQFLYLEGSTLTITGVFEDSDKAAELACSKDGDANDSCDVLNSEFPMDSAMLPQLIELLVKELYGAAYRPADDTNDDKDDLASLHNFMRNNTKSSLAKAIE